MEVLTDLFRKAGIRIKIRRNRYAIPIQFIQVGQDSENGLRIHKD